MEKQYSLHWQSWYHSGVLPIQKTDVIISRCAVVWVSLNDCPHMAYLLRSGSFFAMRDGGASRRWKLDKVLRSLKGLLRKRLMLFWRDPWSFMSVSNYKSNAHHWFSLMFLFGDLVFPSIVAPSTIRLSSEKSWCWQHAMESAELWVIIPFIYKDA